MSSEPLASAGRTAERQHERRSFSEASCTHGWSVGEVPLSAAGPPAAASGDYGVTVPRKPAEVNVVERDAAGFDSVALSVMTV
jgi:hypothetical protein